jgi:hypothetical protein
MMNIFMLTSSLSTALEDLGDSSTSLATSFSSLSMIIISLTPLLKEIGTSVTAIKATGGLKAFFAEATTGAIGLETALGTLLPIIMGIVAVVSVVATIADYISKAGERAQEAIDTAMDSYDEAISKVESLNEELETTK